MRRGEVRGTDIGEGFGGLDLGGILGWLFSLFFLGQLNILLYYLTDDVHWDILFGGGYYFQTTFFPS